MSKVMRAMLMVLVALNCGACGAEASSDTGAWGSGAYDGMAGSDAGVSDAANSWAASDTASGTDAGSSAADGWGGWAESDAASSADATSGADTGEADGGGQSWQQQSDSPPVAQVSLGGGETLELVSMRVAVRIEGLRARVLVDHIFYNPFPKTIEGDLANVNYTSAPRCLTEKCYSALVVVEGTGTCWSMARFER